MANNASLAVTHGASRRCAPNPIKSLGSNGGRPSLGGHLRRPSLNGNFRMNLYPGITGLSNSTSVRNPGGALVNPKNPGAVTAVNRDITNATTTTHVSNHKEAGNEGRAGNEALVLVTQGVSQKAGTNFGVFYNVLPPSPVCPTISPSPVGILKPPTLDKPMPVNPLTVTRKSIGHRVDQSVAWGSNAQSSYQMQSRLGQQLVWKHAIPEGTADWFHITGGGGHFGKKPSFHIVNCLLMAKFCVFYQPRPNSQ